jgi:hypothetical protein
MTKITLKSSAHTGLGSAETIVVEFFLRGQSVTGASSFSRVLDQGSVAEESLNVSEGYSSLENGIKIWGRLVAPGEKLGHGRGQLDLIASASRVCPSIAQELTVSSVRVLRFAACEKSSPKPVISPRRYPWR